MSFYTTFFRKQPWDWPPGADAVPSRGGLKGKLQGLNSFVVWAGGPGGTSGRERPEHPERGNANQSELEQRTADTKSWSLMVLCSGVLHRGQDCCSESRWDAGWQKKEGKDILSLLFKESKPEFPEPEGLKEQPRWSRIVMKITSPKPFGSDKSCCPLRCSKAWLDTF